MANIEGLREPLRSIVMKIIQESGGRVTVVSGFRTHAEQQALYQKYLSGSGNLAAKPGSSKHEHGMAVDFGGDLSLAAQLAAKYGLAATVPGEPWHFQLGGGQTYDADDHDPQYDLTGAETENPQDVLANRLHSIMRIIGQSATTRDPFSQSPGFDDPEVDEAFGLSDSEAIPDYEAFTQAMGETDGLASAGQAGGQAGGGLGGFASAGAAGATGGAGGAKSALIGYAAQQFRKYGWSPDMLPALITLWNKESGWNPNADNPTSTAYGIAQFLDSTWSGVGAKKTSDPRRQIDAGLQYIAGRYGNPRSALNFHLRKNWY